MTVTGATLRIARESRGWTQQDLADKSGLGRVQISRLESSAKINLKFFTALDGAFGGTTWREEYSMEPLAEARGREIFNYDSELSKVLKNLKQQNFQNVPVVGIAGADAFAFSFDAPVEEYLPVFLEGPKGRRYAALKVSGACMEPSLHDGEYVIIAETDTVADGKLGVFRLDGGCTIKRFFRRDGHVELKPDNPKFKSIKLATNKLEIVGAVVGKYGKL